MLKEVRRPDKQKVTFTYDALGRRLTKHFSRTTTHFLWSGNETGRYISEDPIGFLSGEPNFFAYVSDTNAWLDLLGLEGSIYANAREMTDKEIARFFGDEKWHKTNAKKNYLGIFKKEMKGDINADFHINKDTNDIYLKTNEKEIWINTGDKLE